MILVRNAHDRFSTVVREWADARAVVIGGGPSLTQDQVELVHAVREEEMLHSIAVNDAYLWAPWADVHYAADWTWHAWHTAGIAKPRLGLTAEQVRQRWEAFAGQKCSIQNSSVNILNEAVHILKNKHHPNHGHGLSLEPDSLVTGRNSGFQAINLAILAGARQIILLGFDGRIGADGRAHWHDDHPRPTPPAAYQEYRLALSAAENEIEKAGVSVVNCSPGSAFDNFPKRRIEEAIAWA